MSDFASTPLPGLSTKHAIQHLAMTANAILQDERKGIPVKETPYALSC